MRLLQRPLAYPPLCCPSRPTRHSFSCRTDHASPLWSLLASQHPRPSSSTTATPLSQAAVVDAVALQPSPILLILPSPMHQPALSTFMLSSLLVSSHHGPTPSYPCDSAPQYPLLLYTRGLAVQHTSSSFASMRFFIRCYKKYLNKIPGLALY